jgi:hypothetical protein
MNSNIRENLYSVTSANGGGNGAKRSDQKNDFAFRPARARLVNMLCLKLRDFDIAASVDEALLQLPAHAKRIASPILHALARPGWCQLTLYG